MGPLHQGIEDTMLPWAIPKFSHVDGAKGGDAFDRSGTFYVPKIGTKVLIEYQNGDPHYPVWKGYTVDDTTTLKEIVKNYPNRAIERFSTGAFMMIDTSTNEVWFHNPGDTYKIIQGDLEQDAYGDVQFVIGNSQSNGIDPYFTGEDALPVKKAQQSQKKKVKWKGLGSHGSGNLHIEVLGDYTMKVQGNRIVEIAGDDILKVGGDQIIRVGGNIDMTAGGNLTCKASNIFLN